MSGHEGPGPDYKPPEVVQRQKTKARRSWAIPALLIVGVTIFVAAASFLRPSIHAIRLAQEAAQALKSASSEDSAVLLASGELLRHDLRAGGFRRSELFEGNISFILRGGESYTYEKPTGTLYIQKGSTMTRTSSEALLEALEFAGKW
ncbi:MAG TPA: hypothetical protein VEX38_08880, partial [Fimbriimonadaceae bacterium]|nr:hypothetical protein [Fimbriimonadaceae bacterium]